MRFLVEFLQTKCEEHAVICTAVFPTPEFAQSPCFTLLIVENKKWNGAAGLSDIILIPVARKIVHFVHMLFAFPMQAFY
jgi:hypothetical protein